MIKSLDSKTLQQLKARAQHLNPTVTVGQKGLTPDLYNELRQTLNAHELVKVKFLLADKEERSRLITQISEFLAVNPVGQVGKTAVFWQAPAQKKSTVPKTR